MSGAVAWSWGAPPVERRRRARSIPRWSFTMLSRLASVVRTLYVSGTPRWLALDVRCARRCALRANCSPAPIGRPPEEVAPPCCPPHVDVSRSGQRGETAERLDLRTTSYVRSERELAVVREGHARPAPAP